MDNFLPQKDELSRIIQEQSAKLYTLLSGLDIDSLQIPENCLYYLKASHMKRLFFSIQTSAHLLYRSIVKSGITLNQVTVMDYGAGVGTLYMLAKMIGCKKVIYNDHLEEWKQSAEAIANAISVHVDEYIVGDIEDTLQHLKAESIECDIIISRNVIEHIYKLDVFYNTIFAYTPKAIVYSSTTANYYNPAANVKHIMWHTKWEKEYRRQREEIIAKLLPAADKKQATTLAAQTKGLGAGDIELAVKDRLAGRPVQNPSIHRSNTCDPFTGVWAEHLLKFEEYKKVINTERYKVSFEPGFWDTHYSKPWKNLLGRALNPLIKLSGAAGIVAAPFIYVIAEPVNRSR